MNWLRSGIGLFVLLTLLGVTYVARQAWGNSPPAPVAYQPVTAAQPLVASATIPATFTPIPTLTNTPPPNTTPTPSLTPTPALTPTPTSVPQAMPRLPDYSFDDHDGPTPSPEFTAVPTLETPRQVTNILLMGNDSSEGSDAPARTDTLIIASINTETQTATMLSIPRDLYVALPGWNTDRINTVVGRGDAGEYPGGGVQMLKDVILYNLGVPIHYYARVDFEGFKQIVDELGGVEIAVSCGLTDWRLKSPELDIHEEESYELFTLEPGIHTMSGDLALWYARSRRTTSDFDRGRRQQQLLRALLNQGLDLELLPQFPALWQASEQMVETDIDIGRALQLAAVAPVVRENGIQHLYLSHGEVKAWTVPTTGAQVQLVQWSVMEETLGRLYESPSINRASRVPLTVEIINGTGSHDMARLAADNLAWYGFVPILSENTAEAETTTLTYYAQNLKGSYDWLISWVFRLGRDDIQLISDQEADYKYEVTLGSDYDPCRNPLYAPRPNP